MRSTIKKWNLLILLWYALSGLSGLYAQTTQVKVSGVVTDNKGEQLIGVSVVEMGGTNGTVTNNSGNFSLEISKKTTQLKLTYVGYVDKIIDVREGDNFLDVVLEEKSEVLDELVVVGYGTMKKSDLTGAVSSLDGSKVEERRVTQVSQALQGAMPGLMVTRSSGAPGATASIRIRGITTIGDSNPLVIVDGVPTLGINDINPNDIESISVLKDAASASIYGSRAAAGVILITTKRAKSGDLTLHYNTELSFEKPTVLPDFVGVQRYMQMVNELRWNDNSNIPGSEFSVYEPELIDNYFRFHNENPDVYPLTDWTKLILRSAAPKQSHNLNISAGSKNVQSKISFGYDKIEGLYTGTDYNRFTARFNNDISINKYLSSSVDFYYKRSMYDDPSVNPILEMRRMPPIYAAVWTNGLIAEGKGGQNIYARLKYGGYNKQEYNQLGGKASISLKPIDGLTLSYIISGLLNSNKEKQVRQKIQYTYYDNPNIYIGMIGSAIDNSLKEIRPDNYRLTSQVLANFNKDFGLHGINSVLGFESFQNFSESMSAASANMQFAVFPYLDLANSNQLTVLGDASASAYNSFFGRVAYSYAHKYLLQGNFRYDGSSRFAPNYRWGFFPSASAGWIITEEPFMNFESPLSFLKLRVSWGRLGNERIGNYPYQTKIVFGDALFYNGTSIVSSTTARQAAYAMKDITWETTESVNFGVDANFFKNKLQLTGDYYWKTTHDMLLSLEIPDYIGLTNPQQNTGKMYTKGWETEVRWQDNIGKLNYSISANISDFKSVMGDLGGIEFLGNKVKFKGSEFDEWYGYKTDGIFQTQEEVDDSPKLNTNVGPGDIKLVDVSGPEGIPDGVISPDYDRVLLGGSLPRYIFGGNIAFEYENFNLSFVLQGVGKQTVLKSSNMIEPYQSQYGNFQSFLDGNYWSVYNTPEKNNSVEYPKLSLNSRSNNYAMSDYWLFNGGYLRVKNITFGYKLPKSIVQSIKMKDIGLYVSIVDLLSINKYPKGWDPEVSDSGYPITTSFIFGLSLKF